MRISKRLNLVIPVEQQGGERVYVHSVPIDRASFERHFLVLSKTFARIYGEGLDFRVGPRVAALMLREVVGEDKWETSGKPLMSEIRRLTNVVYPGHGAIPFQEVIDKSMMDEDDVAEVENAIVFFTVAWHMHRREDVVEIVMEAAKLWGALTTYLSYTEYEASLMTSTGVASTGATAGPSSMIP